MRRQKSNHTVLLEVSSKFFNRSRRRYSKVYLHEGSLKKAKKLPYDFIDAVDYYKSQHKAKEIGDWICSQYVNSIEVDVLKDITKDKRSYLIIKKEILKEAGKLLFSFTLAEKFLERYGIKEVIDFIPKDFSYEIYQIIRQKQGLLPDRVHIPSWYLQRIKRQDSIKRLVFRSAIRLYPILISFLMWGKRVKKKSYKWGLHIWNTYINSVCQYFVNVLVKENRIDDNNLLYVIDSKITKENFKKIKSGRSNYCSFTELAKNFSFWCYIKEILPSVIRKQKAILDCADKKTLLTIICFRTLRAYISWEMFYKLYQVDDFVYIQDPGEIAHILLQKSHGSKGTFIYLSSSYFLLEVANSPSQAIIYYSCMPHDRFISSQIALDFLKANNDGLISNYTNIGILFSNIVFGVKHNEALKKRIKKELAIPKDKIVISYFDVSVGKCRWFNDAEGAQIIADILKLLSLNKDYFLIYKPKKDYQNFPVDSLMQKAIKKIISSERVLHIDKSKKEYQAAHIMGVSDLVISASGSSTGFEAVAGGIKSIYYAPNNRYSRDCFIVNKFPKFCAYGYKQLEDYADYWLNQCGESVFRDFQEQYIKKYIDIYCDGGALNRLEDILREKRSKIRVAVNI